MYALYHFQVLKLTSWKLKSREFHSSKGEENSKFFNQYANYGKNINTIWKVFNMNGHEVYTFYDISRDHK
jgi:hypothetical protein